MPTTQGVCPLSTNGSLWEDAMVEIIAILRQEHRNIEKLLLVIEQELTVFDRGERPDYQVFGAIIEFFKNYPDTCHHPRRTSFMRNLGRGTLVEQRRLCAAFRKGSKPLAAEREHRVAA
jgi:hemerythrin-like domain-containing protein